MEINLIELWGQMGLPVKVVVFVLTAQAIGCITVTIDRLIVLYQSRKHAQQFAEVASGAMQAGQYQDVLRSISDLPKSHLTSFLDVGIRSFLTRRNAGDGVERAAELTRRALERKGDAVSRELNRGMNVLASTGSTAPFVGLLGTVLGIINAFKLIAADGSGGIGTIGAAIGEALIVTGYGLMVAIPSVLLFNLLSSLIAKYEAGLLNAGSELIDQLETADESQTAGVALSAQPAPAAAAAWAHQQAPDEQAYAAEQQQAAYEQQQQAAYEQQQQAAYEQQQAAYEQQQAAYAAQQPAYTQHESGPAPAPRSAPPLPQHSSAPPAPGSAGGRSALLDRLNRAKARSATAR